MPRNQSTAARRARAIQREAGGKYTPLLREQRPADLDQCATCRYARTLHPGGRCPEPAVHRFGERDYDGPSWGGYLHTHGTEYWVIARADAGRGPWVTPTDIPGGADAWTTSSSSSTWTT